jgi:hypothetical protein
MQVQLPSISAGQAGDQARIPLPRMTVIMPLTIYPYLLGNSCWVFDDERTGLKEEAFVLGMSEMISRVVEARSIPRAAAGFALTFDEAPFQHDVELRWLAPTKAAAALHYRPTDIPAFGNWYKADVLGQEMIGWLCPALFLYFNQAPKTIYAKAEPLPANVDPLWHVSANDPRARRFVSASGEFCQ